MNRNSVNSALWKLRHNSYSIHRSYVLFMSRDLIGPIHVDYKENPFLYFLEHLRTKSNLLPKTHSIPSLSRPLTKRNNFTIAQGLGTYRRTIIHFSFHIWAIPILNWDEINALTQLGTVITFTLRYSKHELSFDCSPVRKCKNEEQPSSV